MSSASAGPSSSNRISISAFTLTAESIGLRSAWRRRRFGNRKIERRAATGFSFSPRAAAVLMDNASNLGQADADSSELARPLESLKHTEEFAGASCVEANAIVANKDDGFRSLVPGPDLDLRLGTPARVLDGVGKQIK